jgi:hypothetical protein
MNNTRGKQTNKSNIITSISIAITTNHVGMHMRTRRRKSERRESLKRRLCRK